MSGNVWEWTLDSYHVTYEGAPVFADLPWGDLTKCHESCYDDLCHLKCYTHQFGDKLKVIRGGAWSSSVDLLRLTARDGRAASRFDRMTGFRPVGLSLSSLPKP